MKFTTRHIGRSGINPSTFIELTVDGNGYSITEDVTNLHGKVDENLIMELREIADELEEQNKLLIGNK